MSRIANNPVACHPASRSRSTDRPSTSKAVKVPWRSDLHRDVEVEQEEGVLTFGARNGSKAARAMSGTTRAIVSNMVKGVTEGWERRLELQGVGYRAQAQGKKLNLQLGFSHPVEYQLPEGSSGRDTQLRQKL